MLTPMNLAGILPRFAYSAVGEVIRTDGSNRFACQTMTRRLPGVVESVLQYNPDYDRETVRNLRYLASTLLDNGNIPTLDFPAPDYDNWSEFCDGHQAATWLNSDWFSVEMYFYRQVLSAVHWWDTRRDPYGTLKRRALLDPTLWQWIDETENVSITDLWGLALRGNRYDLCHPCQHNGNGWSEADLLMDERALIEDHLFRTSGDIHYVCDNAGTELAMDLCLMARILQCTSTTIYLHVKMLPTLVSDATRADVLSLLEMLDMSHYTRLAGHLKALIQSRRLRIVPDLFWDGPDPMAALPIRLRAMFAHSALVILKGDMNYRRLVGDVLGSCDTPLEQVIAGFPAPVAVLRTLKSDPLFGFDATLARSLDAADAEWRTNGKRGIIQFCQPPFPHDTAQSEIGLETRGVN